MSLGCFLAHSIQRQLCNGPKLGNSSTLTEAFRCGAVNPCIDNHGFHRSITINFKNKTRH